ncbi:unnamed protein product [Brachionus calyciflorus]|uniref:Uncharacterized protein n=1 Tax=Brachionus calyciflorus TaxID=104777 RepID=A0A813NEV9_9BILA|nr:unnamed protein product [Brachionus calyciflorus]
MSSSDRWLTFKRFIKRNEIVFYTFGLLAFSHLVWWEIQQIRSFVPKKERVDHLGPFKIPYLDEFDFIKKRIKKSKDEDNEN